MPKLQLMREIAQTPCVHLTATLLSFLSVFTLPPHLGPHTHSAATLTVCFQSRGSVTMCCLCELLVFTDSHTECKQKAFHLANMSVCLQNCTQGKRGDGEADTLSLFLSLYLCLSLTKHIIWVTYSAFEPLPSLGHRCEHTQTPEGLHQ